MGTPFDTADPDRFREAVRRWLTENRVDGLEHLAGMEVDPSRNHGPLRPDLDLMAERLVEAGLMCAAWPKEFGGLGLGPVQTAIYNEELVRAGLPRLYRGMGEMLVGPAVIAHGTDEQRARLLPRIIDGTDRYCQGFSEPNAGSDLASLQTRGVVDGDEVVINGQKVWTSWSRDANVIFTLCRTNPEAPKHRGISYVLVPMDQLGVEVRPLLQLTGGSEFSEVFFSDARAALQDVIGGIDGGWKAAMTTLGSERGGRATVQHLRYEREFWAFVDAARKLGRLDDPLVRQEGAWAYSRVQIMRFAGLRLVSRLAQGQEPGPESTITKLFWSEYHRRFAEMALNLQGVAATIRPERDGEPLDTFEGESYRLDPWQQQFLSGRAETIYAGSSEIQRNIIAERALGLPKEPTPSS